VRVTGFVFGPELLTQIGAAAALAALAMVTIVGGSLAALPQDNLKRLLAFSTVSQLSYVVLGAALGTPEAVAGGVMHIAAHAVLKITLFFCAGSLYVAAHVERVSEMRGVGWRMPYTMGAFTVAAVLLAGLPPGPAFVSKWRLLAGAAEVHAWLAMAALLTSTLLNLAYFVPIVVRAFSLPTERGVAEAPAAMVGPLLVTAAAGLALGLAPDGLLSILSLAARTAASVAAP
jgi:multicomponent Na+:H+ antiporter subunit D